MTTLMWLNVGLAGLTTLLAVIVLVTYWRNHREVGSPFTRALTLFALFLVVHNGLLVYHLATMMVQFSALGETTLLAENLLQAAALSALLWATMR